jgi:signal transduction histidine kinase
MLAPNHHAKTMLDPLHVLIVDDSAFCRQSLESVIRGVAPPGSYVHAVSNGDAAMQHLHDPKLVIDCVILDLHLEHESGLDVLSRIKELRDDIAIVMVTGDNDMGTALRCLQAGAEDYVVKGEFTSDTLERTLRYAVERVHTRLENQQLQEALQAERQVNTMQRSFINLVNHEFRTPLAIIYSATQWLQQSGVVDNPMLQKRLDKIDRAIKRMEGLMNNVTVLDQFEEGKLQCRPQEVALHHFLREIIASFHDALPAPRIHLDVEAMAERVMIDPMMLNYVVSNVLSNALKFSSETTQVAIWGKTLKASLVLYIQDHGAGIAPEDLSKIGQKFFRSEPTSHIPGTGLGLFLAEQLLQYQDGHLYITSEVGKGTTIKLYMPCEVL